MPVNAEMRGERSENHSGWVPEAISVDGLNCIRDDNVSRAAESQYQSISVVLNKKTLIQSEIAIVGFEADVEDRLVRKEQEISTDISIRNGQRSERRTLTEHGKSDLRKAGNRFEDDTLEMVAMRETTSPDVFDCSRKLK
jgi:hypothetical protein